MTALLLLLLFALVLLILSEPLYITVKKNQGTSVAFHFVFFSLSLSSKRKDRDAKKKSKRIPISPSTYLKAWFSLRKRIKIKIDAIYIPLNLSPYAEALLFGLSPQLCRGNYLFDTDDETSLLLHVETTPLDAIVFYQRCVRYEKIKKEG